jgi:hypothetical protein
VCVLLRNPEDDDSGEGMMGNKLGLGDKLPMSFGKGGGFEEEEDEMVPMKRPRMGSESSETKLRVNKKIGLGDMLPLSFGKGGGYVNILPCFYCVFSMGNFFLFPQCFFLNVMLGCYAWVENWTA